jgi:hypothetical protein
MRLHTRTRVQSWRQYRLGDLSYRGFIPWSVCNILTYISAERLIPRNQIASTPRACSTWAPPSAPDHCVFYYRALFANVGVPLLFLWQSLLIFVCHGCVRALLALTRSAVTSFLNLLCALLRLSPGPYSSVCNCPPLSYPFGKYNGERYRHLLL